MQYTLLNTRFDTSQNLSSSKTRKVSLPASSGLAPCNFRYVVDVGTVAQVRADEEAHQDLELGGMRRPGTFRPMGGCRVSGWKFQQTHMAKVAVGAGGMLLKEGSKGLPMCWRAGPGRVCGLLQPSTAAAGALAAATMSWNWLSRLGGR
jgi:hypothetical protein